jgi:ectoine hydroxylase-related dioxygenase (phytanoyl-CoA dioxygenase family)
VDVLERQQYDADGYVVREGVFTNAEIGEMVDACEQLVADLVSDRQGRRIHAGSYVFDPDVTRQTMIKWEGDSDIVHGIEPFAHLSPALDEWAHDPRFLDLARDVLGAEPMLFTEKLNLKRPRHGGVNPMHQDHPYWVGTADDADRVMTIMLMLDDATLANGCLHVVPGSHKAGEWDKRSDTDVFGQNEIDSKSYANAELVSLEMKAGSLVAFGPFLVHQSAPNTSDTERRALLFSYQPVGFTHIRDMFKPRPKPAKPE